MTKGNHLFYFNGLPYDGADRVLFVAKEYAKAYNTASTVRCTFTDDELVIHRRLRLQTSHNIFDTCFHLFL